MFWKKLKPAAIWPQVNELSVGSYYYYVTLIYFLFLIITNTYCGLLDYGRSYAHLFYSFYLEIRSVKCSPPSICFEQFEQRGAYGYIVRTGDICEQSCDLPHLATFLISLCRCSGLFKVEMWDYNFFLSLHTSLPNFKCVPPEL